MDIPTGKVEETISDESSEPQCQEAAESDKTENVFEIQLTDDLADSLVNPPTDTEVMEENIIVKTPPSSEENAEGDEEELKINPEETSETINTSKAVKNVKNEVKVDLNSEDREICEITDQISTRKIENSTKFANTLDNEELNSNCKNLTESDDNLNKNVLSTNPEMNKKSARNEKKRKQKKQKRRQTKKQKRRQKKLKRRHSRKLRKLHSKSRRMKLRSTKMPRSLLLRNKPKSWTQHHKASRAKKKRLRRRS
jgi:hypothetical protein